MLPPSAHHRQTQTQKQTQRLAPLIILGVKPKRHTKVIKPHRRGVTSRTPGGLLVGYWLQTSLVVGARQGKRQTDGGNSTQYNAGYQAQSLYAPPTLMPAAKRKNSVHSVSHSRASHSLPKATLPSLCRQSCTTSRCVHMLGQDAGYAPHATTDMHFSNRPRMHEEGAHPPQHNPVAPPTRVRCKHTTQPSPSPWQEGM